VGGAHYDPELLGTRIKTTIMQGFAELNTLSVEALREDRYQKYRKLGAFTEALEPVS
jgi:acetyl-CoA carboxylase carboxyl transferase subunit alpha